MSDGARNRFWSNGLTEEEISALNRKFKRLCDEGSEHVGIILSNQRDHDPQSISLRMPIFKIKEERYS